MATFIYVYAYINGVVQMSNWMVLNIKKGIVALCVSGESIGKSTKIINHLMVVSHSTY